MHQCTLGADGTPQTLRGRAAGEGVNRPWMSPSARLCGQPHPSCWPARGRLRLAAWGSQAASRASRHADRAPAFSKKSAEKALRNDPLN